MRSVPRFRGSSKPPKKAQTDGHTAGRTAEIHKRNNYQGGKNQQQNNTQQQKEKKQPPYQTQSELLFRPSGRGEFMRKYVSFT